MIKKLSESTYYMKPFHDTDRPSLGLICGDKYSLVIDSGNSPKHAQEFLEAVSKMDVPKIKYLVITHYHWDHIFGINKMNLVTIGHKNCYKEIENLQKLAWDDESLKVHVAKGVISKLGMDAVIAEIPNREDLILDNLDITFDDSIEIDLGNKTCVIKHIGGCHTTDSTVVYVPDDKIMFLGDCIYGRKYEGVYGYDMSELCKMIDAIDSFDVNKYIVSHEDEPYTPEMLKELWDLIRNTYTIAHEGLELKDAITRYESTFGQVSDAVKFFLECFIKLEKKNLHSIWNIS